MIDTTELTRYGRIDDFILNHVAKIKSCSPAEIREALFSDPRFKAQFFLRQRAVVQTPDLPRGYTQERVSLTPVDPVTAMNAMRDGQDTVVEFRCNGAQSEPQEGSVRVAFSDDLEIRTFASQEEANAFLKLRERMRRTFWDRFTNVVFHILYWLFSPIWFPGMLIAKGFGKLGLGDKVRAAAKKFPALGKFLMILALLAKAGAGMIVVAVSS
jgi:hypothetical protein